MTFSVVQPPKDEAKFAEVGKELFEASSRLGMTIEVEGFLHAWVAGTRVVVDRDDSGQITTLAMIAVGKRWVDNEHKATVLLWSGDREKLIAFVRQIGGMMGLSSVLIEEPGSEEVAPGELQYRVTEYLLR